MVGDQDEAVNPAAQPREIDAVDEAQANLKSQPVAGDLNRVATEEELQKFKELTQAALKRLPRISDIQALPSHLRHYTPPSIVQAATAIGTIEEQLKANPGLAAETQKFYGTCVNNAELAKQVRALCLNYSWNVEKNYKSAAPSFEAADLDDVSSLARRL